ncbi:MAG TPA: Txe/YoeB family addiction module toxin [Lacunisphaera sp.]|nr:Txe/YoeB family addiction module toxin [Lacunisphaera sp.]
MARELVFSKQGWEDYQHWLEIDLKQVRRINHLIKEIMRAPFSGMGKPEPLKHAFHGWWSRRIDGEHRIVYKVAGDQLWIAQLRYHY